MRLRLKPSWRTGILRRSSSRPRKMRPTGAFKTASYGRESNADVLWHRLFDLVVHDGSNPDLYVALDVNTGAISLVSSTTNGGVTQDGKCTTVFGVSCRGSLLLEYMSTTYLWTTTSDGSTIATPGTPATDNTADTLNTMLLLPARIQTPVDPPTTSSGVTNTSTRRRRSPGTTPWKRDMSQFGKAQRCPGFNSPMIAVSNGRAGSAPNGCGPDGACWSRT